MGFLNKFRDKLEYKAILKQSIINASEAYLVSSLSLQHFNVEKKEAFSKYSLIMDTSERYWEIHKRLLWNACTSKTASQMAKYDAIGLARIYEESAKRLALIANGLAVIGGFQPMRSMEMIENKAEYPIIEGENTQKPVIL